MANPTEPLLDRIRFLIAELEDWAPRRSHLPDAIRDHWFNSGMDEAYDNMLDRLYWIIGEER